MGAPRARPRSHRTGKRFPRAKRVFFRWPTYCVSGGAMKNLLTLTIALLVLAAVRPASARTWTAETVDDPPSDVGQVSSLALDSNGRPHIAYFDLINGHLKYA